ncbi:juvenile hormone esterase-like [Calliopsis andreniformis]|uniref:juvenile hormone esterase-like n=1 Tax=Calliopsis andreniformis TaxID=337506 RepID=UPI003FCD043B
MKYLLILVLAAMYFESCMAVCAKTQEGKVVGRQMTTRKGRKIFGFCGIPYAQPPVGNLRFKDPVPKKPWKGTLRAIRDGPQCIQINNGIKGSEDCLHLSVFTPELKPQKLMPVIVYIHGGAFQTLNASLTTTGPQYLLDKGIVLVTLNYRVGPFGFVSTGDAIASGNYGLKDQVLALKWVQRNIQSFGGDPNEVTLVGEDAGGISVHLLTLSNQSKHLFKHTISLSGIALQPGAFTADPSYYNKSRQLAEKNNCTTSSSSDMIDCLRHIDATVLLENSNVFDKLDIEEGFTWLPCKEVNSSNPLLTDTPENLIRDNRMKELPMIIGNTKDDGAHIGQVLEADEELYQQAVTQPVEFIERLLVHYPPLSGKNVTELAIKAKNFYLGKRLPTDRNIIIYRYVLLVSDCFRFFPTSQFLDYLQEIQEESVYVYSFQYRGNLSYAIPLGGLLEKCGVVPGDDLLYMFPPPPEVTGSAQSNIERSENDSKMIELITDLWTSFSNNSVPTSPLLDSNNQWKSLLSNVYLQIGDDKGNTSSTLITITETQRLKFWYDNAPLFDLICSD